MIVRHLRLVHSREPLLTPEQLAFFRAPRTWSEILVSDSSMTPRQWRDGVIDADECGLGLLMYLRRGRSPGAWLLTGKGRRHVEAALRRRSRRDNAMPVVRAVLD